MQSFHTKSGDSQKKYWQLEDKMSNDFKFLGKPSFIVEFNTGENYQSSVMIQKDVSPKKCHVCTLSQEFTKLRKLNKRGQDMRSKNLGIQHKR